MATKENTPIAPVAPPVVAPPIVVPTPAPTPPPVDQPVAETPSTPREFPAAFYVPAKWEITASPDGIRAYNSETRHTFEGPVEEFNAYIK